MTTFVIICISCYKPVASLNIRICSTNSFLNWQWNCPQLLPIIICFQVNWIFLSAKFWRHSNPISHPKSFRHSLFIISTCILLTMLTSKINSVCLTAPPPLFIIIGSCFNRSVIHRPTKILSIVCIIVTIYDCCCNWLLSLTYDCKYEKQNHFHLKSN